jgi:hypothetical protein
MSVKRLPFLRGSRSAFIALAAHAIGSALH